MDLLLYPLIFDQIKRADLEENFELNAKFELTMFKLTVPNL